jgi:hypothetical protein
MLSSKNFYLLETIAFKKYICNTIMNDSYCSLILQIELLVANFIKVNELNSKYNF